VTGPPDEPRAAPVRIALGIEYNGSCFNGWQSQKSPNAVTVQETLEQVLSGIADHPVSLACAGRTDTGVHATAQVVHFETPHPRPEKAWLMGANSMLPDTVSIRWARQASDDFHARFSATARRYRYVIYNNPLKPAILNGLVTRHHFPLNADAMHEAAQALLGENDFSSYRVAACQSSTPMRFVEEIRVNRRKDFVCIDIQANAFLLHMVRNIAGVLIDIGEGRKPATWAGDLLDLRDRTQGGVTAPPHGLYLVSVRYPEEFLVPVDPVYPPFGL